MTPETSPLGILPGDFIVLQVPAGRSLPEGEHIASVAASSVSERSRELVLSIAMASRTVIAIKFTIYPDPMLEGHGFLAGDERPVEYVHQQNLERRLQESIRRVRKGDPNNKRR